MFSYVLIEFELTSVEYKKEQNILLRQMRIWNQLILFSLKFQTTFKMPTVSYSTNRKFLWWNERASERMIEHLNISTCRHCSVGHVLMDQMVWHIDYGSEINCQRIKLYDFPSTNAPSPNRLSIEMETLNGKTATENRKQDKNKKKDFETKRNETKENNGQTMDTNERMNDWMCCVDEFISIFFLFETIAKRLKPKWFEMNSKCVIHRCDISFQVPTSDCY